jgi:hypothetical protein
LSNIFCGNRRPGRGLAARLADKTGISFTDWMLLEPANLRKKVYIAWTFSLGEEK